MVLYAVLIVSGFVGVWFLQFLIDWLIISRIMDEPVKGKLLATIFAYFLASLLYLFARNSFSGFAIYLIGAIVVGYLQYRAALKIEARVADEDVAETFK
ncbi:MAG: hypothetical protein ABJP70_13065 [Erythrobacter sp.]